MAATSSHFGVALRQIDSEPAVRLTRITAVAIAVRDHVSVAARRVWIGIAVCGIAVCGIAVCGIPVVVRVAVTPERAAVGVGAEKARAAIKE